MRKLLGLLFLTTFLIACSSGSPATEPRQGEWATLEDAQGAITVKVTPANLENPGDTIDFRVVMDTHSVELSMDLRDLAVLRTDTGKEARASSWPKGSGHHYEDVLSFSSRAPDGTPLLQGAKQLRLSLYNVDVAERTFQWNLQ